MLSSDYCIAQGRISGTAKNGNGRARKSDERPARVAPPAVPFDGFEIDWTSESGAVRADLALFVARGGRMTLVMGKGNGVAAPGNGKGKRLRLANIVATIDLDSPTWLGLAGLMEGKWRIVKLARERGARIRYRTERREPGRAWLEVPGEPGSPKAP